MSGGSDARCEGASGPFQTFGVSDEKLLPASVLVAGAVNGIFSDDLVL